MEDEKATTTSLNYCTSFYVKYYMNSPARGANFKIHVLIIIMNALLSVLGTSANVLIFTSMVKIGA